MKDNSAGGFGTTINDLGASGAVHFVDGGNLGTGGLTINNNGTLALHTSNGRAAFPLQKHVCPGFRRQFRRGPQLSEHPLNTLTGGMDAFEQTAGGSWVDNGALAAQATFKATTASTSASGICDGFGLSLGNGIGTHTITVNAGVMTSGRGGFNVFSVPANGLNMSLTTVLGDTTGGPLGGIYRDSGLTLFKDGQGVFEINVQPFNQQRVSTGLKEIDEGVLRFSSPVDDALTGQVLLNTSDSAVGVGFDGDTTLASFKTLALAGGLTTPGQSGAFDLDLNWCGGSWHEAYLGRFHQRQRE